MDTTITKNAIVRDVLIIPSVQSKNVAIRWDNIYGLQYNKGDGWSNSSELGLEENTGGSYTQTPITVHGIPSISPNNIYTILIDAPNGNNLGITLPNQPLNNTILNFILNFNSMDVEVTFTGGVDDNIQGLSTVTVDILTKTISFIYLNNVWVLYK